MESVAFLSTQILPRHSHKIRFQCTSYGGGLDLIVLCVVYSYVWAYGLKELKDCVAREGERVASKKKSPTTELPRQ